MRQGYLHSSGYPETYYVDQAILRLTEFGCLSLWSMLGLKASTFVLSRVQSLNTFGGYIKFRGQFTD